MRRTPTLAAFVVAALLAAPALAQQGGGDLEQAKMLFSAGAAAYEKHDYVAAIRAFEGAQKLAPRAAIVFALAQAHRHLYQSDGRDADLRAAIDGYRDYLQQVPQGHRHDDAARALEQLNAAAQRASEQNAANISVNSSGTPGAHITIDDGMPVEPPFIGPVAPGRHRVVISADGFVTARRDITAVAGKIVALDVPLHEKLAVVTLAAPSGANVSVDGRPMGTAPLATPLKLAAGVHLLAVTENGRDAFVRELDLSRGETRHVDAPLPASRQRKIALVLLLTSAAGLAASAAFFSVALVDHFQAQSYLDTRATRALTQQEEEAYASLRGDRNDWAVVTAAAFAGATALGLTGLLLYAFDAPSTSGAARRDVVKPKTPHERAPETMDAAIAPLLSPNVLGLAGRVRF